MPQLLSETPAAAPAPPLDALLQQAIELQRADRPLEAERLYRAILAEHPTHPDANHNLGVLTLALNDAIAALPFFIIRSVPEIAIGTIGAPVSCAR